MPRTARLEMPGAINHVYQRGNNRRSIFVDDVDRRFFLRVLSEAFHKHRVTLLSYCLMSNHFHLAAETPKATLGDAMHVVGSRYVQYFNGRHATGGGHLYQERFKSKVVTSDQHFAQLLRYIAHNPVAAGLCAAPEQWPWSSHASQLRDGRHPFVDHARVIELLEVWGGAPAGRYARLFEANGPLAHIDPSVSPWHMRPPLTELVDASAHPDDVRRAREYGYRLREIAALTGLSEPTLSRRARQGG